MSNYLAVATITAALKDLISHAVQNLPAMQSAVEVLSGRPEARDSRFVGVNVCLYQITPNAYFRNNDLATRSKDGNLVQVPVAAVDLHYLITFYGKEQQLEAQRLLGATVAALHTQPMLTKQQLRRTIALSGWLGGSDVDEQQPSIKLTPVGLSLEELSKIWTVFFQTAHALSVAYVASPVLISPEVPVPTIPIVTRHAEMPGGTA